MCTHACAILCEKVRREEIIFSSKASCSFFFFFFFFEEIEFKNLLNTDETPI